MPPPPSPGGGDGAAVFARVPCAASRILSDFFTRMRRKRATTLAGVVSPLASARELADLFGSHCRFRLNGRKPSALHSA